MKNLIKSMVILLLICVASAIFANGRGGRCSAYVKEDVANLNQKYTPSTFVSSDGTSMPMTLPLAFNDLKKNAILCLHHSLHSIVSVDKFSGYYHLEFQDTKQPCGD